MVDVSRARLGILFAGSPDIAVPSLRMIADGAKAGRWSLVGILTNPDTHRGRSRSGEPEPTAVGRLAAQLAKEFSVPDVPALLKCETLKAESREAVSALKTDLLVSFAYGRIFGPRFLALFPLGGINIHPSLLPKYRGASPIQEAILRRDTQTGICVQRIAAEMDTGNILAQEIIPLTGRETAASLGEHVARRGAELLETVLEQFRQSLRDPVQSAGFTGMEGIPQQGEPSYCTLLEKDSGIIDWNRSAQEIDAQIRACNPWPLARTGHNGQILNILEATPYSGPDVPDIPDAVSGRVLGIDKKTGILVQTGDGILAVSLLQYQARKVLPWQAFLNGTRGFIGSRLLLGGS